MLTNTLLCIQGSGEYSSTNSSCPQCPSRCGMPATTTPGVDWSAVGAGGGSGSGGGSNRDRQSSQQVRQLIQALYSGDLTCGVNIDTERLVHNELTVPAFPTSWPLGKSGHNNNKQIVWRCVTVKIFGDYNNKSKFNLGGD
jgi:hypothetical protein